MLDPTGRLNVIPPKRARDPSGMLKPAPSRTRMASKHSIPNNVVVNRAQVSMPNQGVRIPGYVSATRHTMSQSNTKRRGESHFQQHNTQPERILNGARSVNQQANRSTPQQWSVPMIHSPQELIHTQGAMQFQDRPQIPQVQAPMQRHVQYPFQITPQAAQIAQVPRNVREVIPGGSARQMAYQCVPIYQPPPPMKPMNVMSMLLNEGGYVNYLMSPWDGYHAQFKAATTVPAVNRYVYGAQAAEISAVMQGRPPHTQPPTRTSQSPWNGRRDYARRCRRRGFYRRGTSAIRRTSIETLRPKRGRRYIETRSSVEQVGFHGAMNYMEKVNSPEQADCIEPVTPVEQVKYTEPEHDLEARQLVNHVDVVDPPQRAADSSSGEKLTYEETVESSGHTLGTPDETYPGISEAYETKVGCKDISEEGAIIPDKNKGKTLDPIVKGIDELKKIDEVREKLSNMGCVLERQATLEESGVNEPIRNQEDKGVKVVKLEDDFNTTKERPVVVGNVEDVLEAKEELTTAIAMAMSESSTHEVRSIEQVKSSEPLVPKIKESNTGVQTRGRTLRSLEAPINPIAVEPEGKQEGMLPKEVKKGSASVPLIYGNNTKCSLDSVKRLKRKLSKVDNDDTVIAALSLLRLFRLITPIPRTLLREEATDLSTCDISMAGSLEDYPFDPDCCDNELEEALDHKEHLVKHGTMFFWKCHLRNNEQGNTCWCFCCFDFFGSFVKKQFSVDCFGFEEAHAMANRCRQNAEAYFHKLWIQQNRDSLGCSIPCNVTSAVLERLVQLDQGLQRLDKRSPLGLNMKELARRCSS